MVLNFPYTKIASFGKITMLIVRDVAAKVDSCETHAQELIVRTAEDTGNVDPMLAIQTLVLDEISRSVHNTGKKGDSAARNILRLMRFVDFFKKMCGKRLSQL